MRDVICYLVRVTAREILTRCSNSEIKKVMREIVSVRLQIYHIIIRLKILNTSVTVLGTKKIKVEMTNSNCRLRKSFCCQEVISHVL